MKDKSRMIGSTDLTKDPIEFRGMDGELLATMTPDGFEDLVEGSRRWRDERRSVRMAMDVLREHPDQVAKLFADVWSEKGKK